jgi:hypothetical protein
MVQNRRSVPNKCRPSFRGNRRPAGERQRRRGELELSQFLSLSLCLTPVSHTSKKVVRKDPVTCSPPSVPTLKTVPATMTPPTSPQAFWLAVILRVNMLDIVCDDK